ncbi:MAG: hypothetical protein GC168_00335 [Candidatus Hydrogenedens sp.]|nr:hypothetical protein [Candidatus Hydrogenedens sp.]
MVLNLPLILALIRLLSVTRKPMQCAVIYTVLTFGMGALIVMAGLTKFPELMLWTLVRFATSAAYFWLLHENSDSGTWWAILPFGALVSYF